MAHQGGDTLVISQQADRMELLEHRVLSSAGANDFVVQSLLGVGQSGMVVAARCSCDGLPRPDKLYAVKLLFNFTHEYSSVISNSYENEWLLLSRLLPHNHIIRFWVQFISPIPDAFLRIAPPAVSQQAERRNSSGKCVRKKGQFLVLDYHPFTLQSRLSPGSPPLPPFLLLTYAQQLLSALCYLQKEYRICHLDLKLSNVLLSEGGQLVLCDFGSAVQFADEGFGLRWHHGMSVGGNKAHLAPEVCSSHYRCRTNHKGSKVIGYSKQPSFAVGVLLYEMAVGEHPLPDYPLAWSQDGGQVTFSVKDIPNLPPCYSSDIGSLVSGLLNPDPSTRTSLEDGLELVYSLMRGDGAGSPSPQPAPASVRQERDLARVG